jgi:predicted metalloendopeptidase
MTLDDAIKQMSDTIKAACANAEIKTAKMSEEEARLSVYAPAGDMQKIKDAAFQPAMDLLNQEGLDIQVFVYDKDAPPPKG